MLLCYIQSNILMFRLLFIAACIFFTIFSITSPIIKIDLVIFNILFTLINIYLSIPLIKNLVPPEFTKEQKEMYKHHFRHYLSPVELHILLSHHKRRIFRVNSSVVKFGNEFSSLFFIAKIGKNCSVKLKSKKLTFEAPLYSWIGIPEYLHLMSEKESLIKALKEFQTGSWGASLSVNVGRGTESQFLYDQQEDAQMFVLDQINADQSRDMSDENCVIIYEFELRNLDKAFKNSSYGLTIMRGLHSIWLKYCSDIVRRVDKSAANPGSSLMSQNSLKNKSSDFYLKKKSSNKDLIEVVEDITSTPLSNIRDKRTHSPSKIIK
jgi:hypothetical protein